MSQLSNVAQAPTSSTREVSGVGVPPVETQLVQPECLTTEKPVLPPEVWGLIARYSDPESLGNLRLVSRLTETSACSVFAGHFETGRMMLSKGCLEFIRQLSESGLPGVVNTLEICRDHLGKEVDLVGLDLLHPYATETGLSQQENIQTYIASRVTVPEAPLAESRIIAHADLFAKQEEMRSSSSTVDSLANLLLSLKNMKALCINSHNKPWGTKGIKRLTGRFPGADGTEFQDFIVKTTLLAIMKSQVSLDKLSILYGGYQAITLANQSLESLKKLGESLHSLHLVCTDDDNLERWVVGFCNFMDIFPHIRQLELTFPVSFDLKLLPRPIILRELESFKVECMACTKDELLEFILPYKDTLRKLHMESVAIDGEPGSWSSLVHKIDESMLLEELKVGPFTMSGTREEWEDQLAAVDSADYEED